MSKRPVTQRAPIHGQADLFGAAPPPAKTQARRAPPSSAKRQSAPAPASDRIGAASIAATGLLNVREAATRLGLSKSTLDKMRCAGNGPRFIKSTDRAVRYDPDDLDEWIAARRCSSTKKS